MAARPTIALWGMFGALVATGGQARALEGRTEPVAPAAKITLGMLSVKPLGVLT